MGRRSCSRPFRPSREATSGCTLGLALRGLVGDAARVQKRTPDRGRAVSGVRSLGVGLLAVAPLVWNAHAAADDLAGETHEPSAAPVRHPKPVVVRRKADAKSKARDAGVIGDASSAAFDGGTPPTEDPRADASVSPVTIATTSAAAVATTDAAVPPSTAAALPTASATAPSTVPVNPVEVRVRDTVVLSLRLRDGGMPAEERARRANRAIERALGVSNAKTVRVEQRDQRSIVFIAEQPVVELTAADAAIAEEGSLDLYSASVAARIADILRAEEQRDQRAQAVFSIVTAILAAVVAIFLIRKIGALSVRVRNWVERNRQHMPAIRFKSIEVVRSPVLHSAALVSLEVAKWIGYIGTIYACLIFILSRFDWTRGYTDKLASLVLSPISTLTARIATLLPLTIIVALGSVVLWILLRFIGLFFGAVERGETRLEQMSPALAAPTSLIVRVGLVVVTLLVVAPALTGNAEGTFAKLGQLAVTALLLACVPLLTTVLLGMRVLYASRLAVGQWVSIGNVTGRVLELTLLDTRIWVSGGVTARVPHLVLLWLPVRTAAGSAHELELTVANGPELAGAVEAATVVAAGYGPDASIVVGAINRRRATLVVRVTMPESKDKNGLLFELVRVLEEHGVPLADAQ